MSPAPRPTLERALTEAAARRGVLPAFLRMDSRTLLGQDRIKQARERALMDVLDLGIWSGPEIAAALGRAPSSISTAVRRARRRSRPIRARRGPRGTGHLHKGQP